MSENSVADGVASGRPVINVLVTEFVTYEVTVDPTAPEWDWLLRYPHEDWPKLLRQSANETDGTLEKACTSDAATGAWREVNLDAVIAGQVLPDGCVDGHSPSLVGCELGVDWP